MTAGYNGVIILCNTNGHSHVHSFHSVLSWI